MKQSSLSLRRMRPEGLRQGAGLDFGRAWRLTTFILVFIGFLGLSFTGEINLLVKLIFVVGWVIGILMSQSPHWWRPWMTQVAMWVPLTVITMIVLHGRFESLLYLLMFLGLFKCLTLREPGDHLQAMLMAFFMLLACTIITTSITYLFFMLIFIMLASLDLVLMTVARERDRSLALGGPPPSGMHPHSPRPLSRRILISSGGYGLLILFVGYLVFLLMPHYSIAQRTNRNPFGLNEPVEDDLISGYSDDLTLKNINDINLDERLVMEVTTAWRRGGAVVDLPAPYALRLRGVVKDHYDGERWTMHSRVGNDKSSDRWRRVDFTRSEGLVLFQWIRQDLQQVERLFAAPMVTSFSNLPDGYSMHLNWLVPRSIKLSRYPSPFDVNAHWVTYRAQSEIQPEATLLLESLSREGRRAPADAPPWLPPSEQSRASLAGPSIRQLLLSEEERRINTQLPPDQVSELITGLSLERMTASSDADKILQLLDWFRSDFEYTLQPRTGIGAHPLETFLTRTRRGHCEFFAASFVLMLRAQGIPARVVLGFYSSEIDPEMSGDNESRTTRYLVRQSDAHAWAEVWLDGHGWLTLDPTTPSYRGRASLMMQTPPLWRRVQGHFRHLWQNYVLDYSSFQQLALYRRLFNSPVVQSMLGLVGPLGDWIERLYRQPERSTNAGGRFPWGSVAALLGLVGVCGLAVVVIIRLTRAGSRHRLAVYGSSLLFVNRLLDKLQKKGWQRSPGQTVAEFLAEVDAVTARQWQLAAIVELYQRCRFAGQQPTPPEEAVIRETLRRIE